MPKLSDWLRDAKSRLKGIDSNVSLELQLIVAKHLNLSLVGQLDNPLISNTQLQRLENDLIRLMNNEPIAYIVGFAEFYGLQFFIHKGVLVPRSDTEVLVDWILDYTPASFAGKILDMGCGSGVIAVSVKKYRPMANMTASDIDHKTLTLTQKNADKNAVTLENHIHSDWFDNIKESYDLIVANPPYIAADDVHLPALHFEPQSALIADNQGLADLEKIICSAKAYLHPKGMLIFEHGFDQMDWCVGCLRHNHYNKIESHCDLSGRYRFCTAMR